MSGNIQFEIRKKLAEALNEGKYLITITRLDEQGILQHYYAFENFKLDDLVPTMTKITADMEINELGKVGKLINKKEEVKPS
jgi:hypothetical protein